MRFTTGGGNKTEEGWRECFYNTPQGAPLQYTRLKDIHNNKKRRGRTHNKHASTHTCVIGWQQTTHNEKRSTGRAHEFPPPLQPHRCRKLAPLAAGAEFRATAGVPAMPTEPILFDREILALAKSDAKTAAALNHCNGARLWLNAMELKITVSICRTVIICLHRMVGGVCRLGTNISHQPSALWISLVDWRAEPIVRS